MFAALCCLAWLHRHRRPPCLAICAVLLCAVLCRAKRVLLDQLTYGPVQNAAFMVRTLVCSKPALALQAAAATAGCCAAAAELP